MGSKQDPSSACHVTKKIEEKHGQLKELEPSNLGHGESRKKAQRALFLFLGVRLCLIFVHKANTQYPGGDAIV